MIFNIGVSELFLLALVVVVTGAAVQRFRRRRAAASNVAAREAPAPASESTRGVDLPGRAPTAGAPDLAASDAADEALGDVTAYAALGSLLVERDQLPEAEEVYRRAIDAGETAFHLEYGFVLWKQLKHEAAERALRAAIALGDTRAYRPLGVILNELGRPDEAIAMLRAAVASGDSDAAATLAEIERDHAERQAAGEPPSAWAEPAAWKVALLREMGETRLAQHFQRRLDEQEGRQ